MEAARRRCEGASPVRKLSCGEVRAHVNVAVGPFYSVEAAAAAPAAVSQCRELIGVAEGSLALAHYTEGMALCERALVCTAPSPVRIVCVEEGSVYGLLGDDFRSLSEASAEGSPHQVCVAIPLMRSSYVLPSH